MKRKRVFVSIDSRSDESIERSQRDQERRDRLAWQKATEHLADDAFADDDENADADDVGQYLPLDSIHIRNK
jgi:hypothetical protein